MVNYPIGIQTFDKIRQGGYLYIDKTKYIYEITHLGQYVFNHLCHGAQTE